MKVSIVMATYNGEKYVKTQIDSILNQTFTDYELIICDDCSTDNTVKILNEYKEKDNRIRIINNEFNLGFKKNFENGLSYCNGEYIAFCDQDDLWTNNHLQHLIDNINNYDLVCGNCEYIDDNENSLGFTFLDMLDVKYFPENKKDYLIYLCHSNCFQGCTILLKKDMLKNALPIPEGVTYHDWWFAFLANMANGAYHTKEVILYYRQHSNNITGNAIVGWNKKIKNYFATRKDNLLLNESKIHFLNAVLNTTKNEEYIGIIKQAIKYRTNKYKLFKSVTCLPYFIKNYNKMYLSKGIVKYIARLFKLFISL